MQKISGVNVPEHGFSLLSDEAQDRATELAEELRDRARSIDDEIDSVARYDEKAERGLKAFREFYDQLYDLDAGADERGSLELVNEFCSGICSLLGLPSKIYEVARLLEGGRA